MPVILQTRLPDAQTGTPGLPGTGPCGAEDWLLMDEAYAPQMVYREALLADRTLEANFRLIVVVVLTDDSSQDMTRERLEQEWHQRTRQCPVAIELRFMSPASLKT